MNDHSEIRSNNGAILGFLVGSIVGAGVALLLAPRSGEETRRRLGETARRVGRDAKGKYEDVRDRLAQGVSGVRDDLHDAVEAGRDTAQKLVSRIPGDSSRIRND